MSRLLRLSVLCSSMLSGTANISRNKRNGNPTAVPLLGAVAGLWSAPDYLTRERQEFKEEGKPQVVLRKFLYKIIVVTHRVATIDEI